MKYAIMVIAGIVSGALFSGCKKSDSYNATTGQTQLSYKMQVTNTAYGVAKIDPGTGGAGSTGPVMHWTSGFANPRKIQFYAKAGSSTVSYSSTTNSQVNLWTTDPAAFGNVALQYGSYDEAVVTMQLENEGEYPALQLAGTLTADQANYQILIQVKEAVAIKTEHSQVTLAKGATFTAATTLDLSGITTNISSAMLDHAEQTNGIIIIAPDKNPQLYKIVRSNLNVKELHCDFQH